MSLPTLLKPDERNDAEWKRKARDLINQTAQRVLGQGVTADRPERPVTGQQFYDFTLGIPVWFNGTAWTNAAGTIV